MTLRDLWISRLAACFLAAGLAAAVNAAEIRKTALPLECAAGQYYFGVCRSESWVRSKFEPTLSAGESLTGIVGSTRLSLPSHLGLVVSGDNRNTTYVVSSTRSGFPKPSQAGYDIISRNIFEYGSGDRAWCTSSGTCNVARVWYTSVTETPTTLGMWTPTEQLAYYAYDTKWITCNGTSCVMAIASVTNIEDFCRGIVDGMIKAAELACLAGAGRFGVGAAVGCAGAISTFADTEELRRDCVQTANEVQTAVGLVFIDDSNPTGSGSGGLNPNGTFSSGPCSGKAVSASCIRMAVSKDANGACFAYECAGSCSGTGSCEVANASRSCVKSGPSDACQ